MNTRPKGARLGRDFVDRVLDAGLPNVLRIQRGDSVWTEHGDLDGPALVTYDRDGDGATRTVSIRVPHQD